MQINQLLFSFRFSQKLFMQIILKHQSRHSILAQSKSTFLKLGCHIQFVHCILQELLASVDQPTSINYYKMGQNGENASVNGI